MKMRKEHYNYMLEAIRPFAGQIANHRKAVADSAKDIEKRIRWDLHRAAGLMAFTCDTLYVYLDDTHIETALKAIVRELEG